ncbi:MAG: MFS transporter [Alphaproteobacteria bacterium]|nr:MFS transporter [Alphaproteobacteria bacterium]
MKNLPASWRLMVAIGCIDLMFLVPVVMAYYQLKGVDIGAFLLLQGLFRVWVLILEVPTGYLADRWSRTSQLTLGAAAWLAGLTCVWQATSFAGLLMGEICMALSVAFYSGTTQAYLHEALHQEGRGHQEATWQGRLFASSTAAEMVAGALGGWLFGWWADGPVLAGMLAATVALAFTASLPKLPKQHAERRHDNPFLDVWLVTHHSLRLHPTLRWLLLGPKILTGFTGLLFWVMQAKLLALHVSPTWLGLSFAAFMGVKTVLALSAGRIAALGATRVLQNLPLFLLVGCGLMSVANPWLVWLGGVLTAGFVHAVGSPLCTTLINREVPNHERATVLSVGSMISQLVGASLMIAATPLLTIVSLNTLMLSLMVVVAGSSTLLLRRIPA